MPVLKANHDQCMQQVANGQEKVMNCLKLGDECNVLVRDNRQVTKQVME